MKRITNDAKIIDLYYLFSPKRDTRRSSSPLLIDTVQQSELSILNNPLTVPPFEDNRVYVSTRCTNLAAERVSARAQIRLIDRLGPVCLCLFLSGQDKVEQPVDIIGGAV